jgi:hypothetical protein
VLHVPNTPDLPNSGPLGIEPLSSEAQEYYNQWFAPRYDELQRRILQIPLLVLVWGPGPNGGILYQKRVQILNQLRRLGHAAVFSEEVDNTTPNLNLPSDMRELLQAELADFIIVLQSSPGSTAEVHDFGRLVKVAHKMLIFVDEHHITGYSYAGLLTELRELYSNVITFKHDEIEQCFLLGKVLERVRVLQYAKFWQMSRE